MLTPTEKAKLFGKRRWEVGGPGRVDGEEVQPRKKVRFSDDVPADSEPVFFHAPCIEYYEDELAMSGAVAVVDFTAGPGYFLWACVMREIPSVGICMSQMHHDVTYAHMVGLCLSAMCKEGHDLYDARFCEVLGAHGQTADRAAKAAAAVRTGAPRAGGNGRGNAKGGRGGRGGRKGGRGTGGQPADGQQEGGGEDNGEDEGNLDAAEGAAAAAGSQGAGSSGGGGGTAPSSTSTAEQRLMAKLAAMGVA